MYANPSPERVRIRVFAVCNSSGWKLEPCRVRIRDGYNDQPEWTTVLRNRFEGFRFLLNDSRRLVATAHAADENDDPGGSTIYHGRTDERALLSETDVPSFSCD